MVPHTICMAIHSGCTGREGGLTHNPRILARTSGWQISHRIGPTGAGEAAPSSGYGGGAHAWCGEGAGEVGAVACDRSIVLGAYWAASG